MGIQVDDLQRFTACSYNIPFPMFYQMQLLAALPLSPSPIYIQILYASFCFCIYLHDLFMVEMTTFKLLIVCRRWYVSIACCGYLIITLLYGLPDDEQDNSFDLTPLHTLLCRLLCTSCTLVILNSAPKGGPLPPMKQNPIQVSSWSNNEKYWTLFVQLYLGLTNDSNRSW